MKEELFGELMESAHEALSHARGKRELRTTVLPGPPAPMKATEVKQLRAQVQASQAVFAHYLNVSTKLVQAWESERRNPEGAALKLLRVAESNPSLVFSDLPGEGATVTERSKQSAPPERHVRRRRTGKKATTKRRASGPAGRALAQGRSVSKKGRSSKRRAVRA